MPTTLLTDRLRIREFTLDDAPFIVRLLNTDGWLRYIGDRHVHNEADARDYLTLGPFKSYAENGFGLWCVEAKETNASIGMCGILKRPELETPDVGFAFLPEFHGQGFALEAVEATLGHARQALHIPLLSAIVQPDNERSIALLTKVGFSFSGAMIFPGKEELLKVYNLSVLSDKW
jgi:RimJ/RimL family protein N-acetyltransferase